MKDQKIIEKKKKKFLIDRIVSIRILYNLSQKWYLK